MQQQPVHANCGSTLLERPHSSQPQMFNHWLLVGEFLMIQETETCPYTF